MQLPCRGGGGGGSSGGGGGVIRGVDVGTGASCIYPLLGVRLSGSDDRDAAVAAENAARKDQAVRALCDKYAGEAIAADDIRLCLCSITDNRSFMRGNRDPVDRLIHYLKSVFSPEVEQPGSSLAICAGRGGSKRCSTHAYPPLAPRLTPPGG